MTRKSLDERISSAEEKISENDRRTVSLEGKILGTLRSIEDRIEEKVESKIEKVISDISMLSNRLDRIDSQHDDTKERVVRSETNIEHLEKKIGEMKVDNESKIKSASAVSDLKAKVFVYGLGITAMAALIKVIVG